MSKSNSINQNSCIGMPVNCSASFICDEDTCSYMSLEPIVSNLKKLYIVLIGSLIQLVMRRMIRLLADKSMIPSNYPNEQNLLSCIKNLKSNANLWRS